ncbi:protein of unknown function DUF642, partial [Dillenia turbinata]
MAPTALLLLLPFFLAISFADLLQNSDFETPPTNITANSITPFVLLTEANTIPGWSFNGSVRYITSGPGISLPSNGHGIQLGQDGKINQTFRADKAVMHYILTFTLAPGSTNCSNHSKTAVNVSADGRSKLFLLEGLYGKETWESHAYFLGQWGYEKKPFNLEIQSASTDNSSNLCWPVVDTFLIATRDVPKFYDGNLLSNGGFEVGPAFVKNSSEGVLLDEEPDTYESELQQWSIIGTVKYIDSKHYFVPEGKAAIELVSGAPSGILTVPGLSRGYTYNLEFMMGDANDLCVGDFIVYVQVGTAIWNFTIKSNGTGSAQKQFLTFQAESTLTPISFMSFNQSQTSDNVYCGPVLDNIILNFSSSNLLSNGGFVVEPAFGKNSLEGSLLDEEPDTYESVLQQRSIIGTVKYIDSKNYFVPEGKAAIQLVSGAPSGIVAVPGLLKGYIYNLEFMMGDANDSCVGDFIVYVQVGIVIRNFTIRSNGTGSAQKQFLTFQAESTLSPISFMSFNRSQTSDH